MTNESPEQIVDKVEAALADSHACPYCGLYDGTHTVTCVYLLHKGDVDAKRNTRGHKAVKTSEDKASEPVKEESAEETKTASKDDNAELLEKMKPKK